MGRRGRGKPRAVATAGRRSFLAGRPRPGGGGERGGGLLVRGGLADVGVEGVLDSPAPEVWELRAQARALRGFRGIRLRGVHDENVRVDRGGGIGRGLGMMVGFPIPGAGPGTLFVKPLPARAGRGFGRTIPLPKRAGRGTQSGRGGQAMVGAFASRSGAPPALVLSPRTPPSAA